MVMGKRLIARRLAREGKKIRGGIKRLVGRTFRQSLLSGELKHCERLDKSELAKRGNNNYNFKDGVEYDILRERVCRSSYT